VKISEIFEAYRNLLLFFVENSDLIINNEDTMQNNFLFLNEFIKDIDKILLKENVAPIKK